MLRSFVLSSIILLSACSAIDSPEKRYYIANEAYIGLLRVAIEYKRECVTFPTESCKANVEKIQQGIRVTNKAFDMADRVFINGDDPFYRLAVTDAENAVKLLNTLVTEANGG